MSTDRDNMYSPEFLKALNDLFRTLPKGNELRLLEIAPGNESSTPLTAILITSDAMDMTLSNSVLVKAFMALHRSVYVVEYLDGR